MELEPCIKNQLAKDVSEGWNNQSEVSALT